MRKARDSHQRRQFGLFYKDIQELPDRAGKLGLESLIGKRARSPVARFRFSVIGTLLARRAILP